MARGGPLKPLEVSPDTREELAPMARSRSLPAGLDDYEVRSAHDWYRHVTLALWALALLAVMRAADLPRPAPKKESGNTEPGRLTCARGLAGG